MKQTILIINGSLHGSTGNSSELLSYIHHAIENQKSQVDTMVMDLSQKPTFQELENSLQKAQAFIFLSGTYWDSWSSHLQDFLEKVTEWEATEKFLGKPAGVIVTMHSVGGKELASRLHGVLNNLGCMSPPMSSVCISLASQLARQANTEFMDDFFSPNDIEILVHNLIAALSSQPPKYKTWEVDRKDPSRKWLK